MVSRTVIASMLLMCAFGARAKPPANWQFQEWDVAVARASAENKPLFVMFGYENCQWCEHLYRRGMNDADLRLKYSQSTVPTYVDTKSPRPDEAFTMPGGEKVTHSELIKRLRAYPTPSWVFISPDGVVLHSNRNGRSTAREMLRDVETAIGKL
jgi:thioredoxin-related protein